MARARLNPIGVGLLHSPLVRIGGGEHSHILNPETGRVICASGKGRAKKPQKLYKSARRYATCYRCCKLASMNVEAGRLPWQTA